jgi:hypothetical protein
MDPGNEMTEKCLRCEQRIAEVEQLRALLRECQKHLACNAVTEELVQLYVRVRGALEHPPGARRPNHPGRSPG